MNTPANQAEFRKALVKLLPGYKWTVHKTGPKAEFMRATGIQSSGSNRTSTIEVTMRHYDSWFDARIAGYGTRAPWSGVGFGGTLAQAIRSLQDGVERQAGICAALARSIQLAREPSKNTTETQSK